MVDYEFVIGSSYSFIYFLLPFFLFVSWERTHNTHTHGFLGDGRSRAPNRSAGIFASLFVGGK